VAILEAHWHFGTGIESIPGPFRAEPFELVQDSEHNSGIRHPMDLADDAPVGDGNGGWIDPDVEQRSRDRAAADWG
jgi:hypothetical protein